MSEQWGRAMVVLLFVVVWTSGILTAYYGNKATFNRKPGVPYFPGDFQQPGNILFRPHQLTEKGLRARKWCFIYGTVFLGILGSAAVVGFFLKFLKLFQ